MYFPHRGCVRILRTPLLLGAPLVTSVECNCRHAGETLAGVVTTVISGAVEERTAAVFLCLFRFCSYQKATIVSHFIF